MRISLLRKREPFDKIICSTIERFLNHTFNKTITVTFNKSEISQDVDFDVLYINQYLNFIASRNCLKENFDPLINEFSRSAKWWRSLPQWMFAHLATYKGLIKVFADSKIYIQPKVNNIKEYIFLGGNNRMRVLHPQKHVSYVVIKSNFSLGFIKNEFSLRSKMFLKHAPKFYSKEFNNLWLKEEYVLGVPLNRIRSIKQRDAVLSEISRLHMDELIVPTCQFIPTKTYINQINKRIKERIDLVGSLNNEIKYEVDGFLGFTKEILSSIETVPISWTHGDFQQGNILINKKKPLVIDWEASDHRFSLYDIITLLSESRKDISYFDRLKEVIKNPLISKYSSTLNINYINERSYFIILYLLEELRYKIDASCNKIFYRSGDNVLMFIRKSRSLINTIVTNT